MSAALFSFPLAFSLPSAPGLRRAKTVSLPHNADQQEAQHSTQVAKMADKIKQTVSQEFLSYQCEDQNIMNTFVLWEA